MTFNPLLIHSRHLAVTVQNSLDRLESEQQTFFTDCKENKQKEWRDAQFDKLRGEYNKILEEADDKVRFFDALSVLRNISSLSFKTSSHSHLPLLPPFFYFHLLPPAGHVLLILCPSVSCLLSVPTI